MTITQNARLYRERERERKLSVLYVDVSYFNQRSVEVRCALKAMTRRHMVTESSDFMTSRSRSLSRLAAFDNA